MKFKLNSPPIAIGGVGGSGTRLVTEITQKAGFFVGGTLNHALDNLYFTLLFKRPEWFRQLPSNEDIGVAVDLFQRAMTIGLESNISPSEKAYINELAIQLKIPKYRTGANHLIAEEIITSKAPNFDSHVGWGWKEPNTHIFLPQIAKGIEDIRYIHVIRNGLDMAFSKNQQQLLYWGSFMNNGSDIGETSLPSQSLDFWIKANTRAIELGTSLLADKFLVVNYDRLCSNPAVEIPRIIDFLGVELTAKKAHQMNMMIAPVSVGRYQNHDTKIFTQSQLDAVKKLGFDIVQS